MIKLVVDTSFFIVGLLIYSFFVHGVDNKTAIQLAPFVIGFVAGWIVKKFDRSE